MFWDAVFIYFGIMAVSLAAFGIWMWHEISNAEDEE